MSVFTTATATELAAFLRRTADQLDAAGDELGDFDGFRAYLHVGTESYTSHAPEHERVAAIHTLARHLDVPVDRAQTHGTWNYEGRRQTGAAVVRVETDITAPAQRCACGRTCTHINASDTRAA